METHPLGFGSGGMQEPLHVTRVHWFRPGCLAETDDDARLQKEETIMEFGNPSVRIRERERWHRAGRTLAVLAVGLLILVGCRSASPSLPSLHQPLTAGRQKQIPLATSLAEALQAARYRVQWSEQTPWKHLPGAYYAYNPAQRLTAFFTQQGIHLQSRLQGAPEWKVSMRLQECGYGKQLFAVTAGAIQVNSNRLEMQQAFPSHPHIRFTEWYENQVAGIEHGFRIDSSPDKHPSGAPLRLGLQVEGDLQIRLAEGGQAVDLLTATGALALRYDKLKAFDADRRELPSRLAVTHQRVWLEIDDREATYPLTIDPMFTQQAQLIAPDGSMNDLFGQSISISGDTVVVGAVADQVGMNVGQGSAYVFIRNGNIWNFQQQLTASDGAASDQFGNAVALDGDTVIVGANFADIQTPDDNRGAAYVFVRSGVTWTQQQKLTASDGGLDDLFGFSVAIRSDSLVVGAMNDDIGMNSNQGSAYVFVRSGMTWTEQQKLTASDGMISDQFGGTVGIDGDTVIVGAGADDVQAVDDDRGSAYVFVRSGMTWTQQQKLTSADGGVGDEFGRAAAISGDTVVVGAPFSQNGMGQFLGAAYIFVRSGMTWTQQQKLAASDGGDGDEFGRAVTISSDTVGIGAHTDNIGMNNDQGSAYVFTRSGMTWTELQKLTAADGAATDRFGESISIDGSTIAVGASSDDVGMNGGQGSAYIFQMMGTGADLQITKNDSADPVAPGSSLTYTLTVTNNGPEDATGVVVSDMLPADVSYLSDTCGTGPPAGNVITWNIGNLANSTSVTCQITVMVAATASCSTMLSNAASVTADQADAIPMNNSDTETTTVVSSPMLTCPSDFVVGTDAGQCARSVVFMVTASGTPAPTIECKIGMMTITSPHVFPVGITTVNCTASNGCAPDAMCSFTVTVEDDEPPQITCPPTQFVMPGVVNLPAPLASDNCGSVGVVCTPPSGSVFPAGVTTVTCTATDTAGNTEPCSFAVGTFDVCLQDDNQAGNQLLFLSTTGDYVFCCADGTMVIGTGLVKKKGTTFTLQHSGSNHRVEASVTLGSVNKGTASLRIPLGTLKCSITDRNTQNNNCLCSP